MKGWLAEAQKLQVLSGWLADELRESRAAASMAGWLADRGDIMIFVHLAPFGSIWGRFACIGETFWGLWAQFDVFGSTQRILGGSLAALWDIWCMLGKSLGAS